MSSINTHASSTLPLSHRAQAINPPSEDMASTFLGGTFFSSTFLDMAMAGETSQRALAPASPPTNPLPNQAGLIQHGSQHINEQTPSPLPLAAPMPQGLDADLSDIVEQPATHLPLQIGQAQSNLPPIVQTPTAPDQTQHLPIKITIASPAPTNPLPDQPFDRLASSRHLPVSTVTTQTPETTEVLPQHFSQNIIPSKSRPTAPLKPPYLEAKTSLINSATVKGAKGESRRTAPLAPAATPIMQPSHGKASTAHTPLAPPAVPVIQQQLRQQATQPLNLQSGQPSSQSSGQQSGQLPMSSVPPVLSPPITDGPPPNIQKLSMPTPPAASFTEATEQWADMLNMADEKWADSLTRRLGQEMRQGGRGFQLDLHPRHLGKLRVQLMVQNDQTHIQMRAETSMTAQILNDATDKLSQMLEQAGLKLGQFESHAGENAFQNPSFAQRAPLETNPAQEGTEEGRETGEPITGTTPPTKEPLLVNMNA